MSKFRFRLAPLLKIRENIRAERQTELSKAYEAARIVEEKLEKIRSDLIACVEEGRQSILAGKISIDFLLSMRRHEAHLLTQQAEARNQLQQIQVEIERRRAAVIEADRDVKVLEKLREKLKERHIKEEALADLKQLDETAGQRSARVRSPE